MIFLVDTNVLLDVLEQRSPFAAVATRLWMLVESGIVVGFVSAISFDNIHYITRRSLGLARASQGVRLVANVFAIAPVDSAVIHQAIVLGANDFEDSIQIISGKQVGATHIVTRDATGFRNSPIPVLSCNQAVALVESRLKPGL